VVLGTTAPLGPAFAGHGITQLQRLRPSAATRSSLAPAWVPPLRSGRHSPDTLRGPSMDAAQTAAAKQGVLPRLRPSAATPSIAISLSGE